MSIDDRPNLTLAEMAAEIRRRQGRGVDVATVRRWATKGVNGVRLETIRVGGRLFTSARALDTFLAAMNRPQPAAC